jgi:hypothetical protein
MKLLIMLVPMLMIGCDGSRESFTIMYDAENQECYWRENNCSCPSGFSVAGWSAPATHSSNALELVCLQD